VGFILVPGCVSDKSGKPFDTVVSIFFQAHHKQNPDYARSVKHLLDRYGEYILGDLL